MPHAPEGAPGIYIYIYASLFYYLGSTYAILLRMTTRHGLDDQGCIPGTSNSSFSTSERPHRLWAAYPLGNGGGGGAFPGGKAAGE
jgi:hypothetical protein